MLDRISSFFAKRALALKMRADPWMTKMMLHITLVLSNKLPNETNEYLQFLQINEDSRRTEADYFSNKLLEISRTANHVVACRAWVIELAKHYARFGIPLLEKMDLDRAFGPHRHATGLRASLLDLLPIIFPESQNHGDAPHWIQALKLNFSREGFRISTAEIGCKYLGDRQSGEKDWLPPLMRSSFCMQESSYRTALGLPLLCDFNELKARHERLVTQLLSGATDSFSDAV